MTSAQGTSDLLVQAIFSEALSRRLGLTFDLLLRVVLCRLWNCFVTILKA